jgi:hypothetical protein
MKNKKLLLVGTAFLFVALTVAVVLAFGTTPVSAQTIERQGNPNGFGTGTGIGTGTGVTGTTGYRGMGMSGYSGYGYAVTPLTSEESTALQNAILEEYGALNLYQAVIDQYGDVYPFDQIVLAEQQHVNALVRQATKYGVAVPENPGLTAEISFATLQGACQAGVDAEIADAALYDDLLPVVSAHSDLVQVFTALQSASLNYHLPAFDLCN